MAPRIGGVRLVHDGWARYLVAEVMQEDGTRLTREMEDHGRAVAVLPYDPERRVATLVSQFRAPVLYSGGPPSHIEVPAGLLDEGASEDEARREALEETGLRLGALDFVASAWSMPGISTERMDLFLAAEGEAVAVHEIPLPELAAMGRRGTITDMKSLTLLFALQLRRPDLFEATR
ncbi:NUDIX domain-containing protein [Methylobacterium phyllosphaerae]